MDNNLLFKHSCFAGDLIYALAGIKSICENNDHKAVIYQWLDQKGHLYQGADHPYGGSMMNEYAFEMLKPLIEAQPYVQSFNKWQGEKVMVDMDNLRQVKMHMPYGNIVTWLPMVFAEMRPEYWKPWIDINRGRDPGMVDWTKFTFDVKVNKLRAHVSDKILINRTSRYHGAWIDYFHLKKYEGKMMFVGMEDEYKTFKADWNLDLPLLEVKDFYELAVAISSCKLFIGNQSMCFAIAEAMKTPRLLEICDFAPNVQPCGDGSYYFRVPELFEYWVNKLMEE